MLLSGWCASSMKLMFFEGKTLKIEKKIHFFSYFITFEYISVQNTSLEVKFQEKIGMKIGFGE